MPVYEAFELALRGEDGGGREVRVLEGLYVRGLERGGRLRADVETILQSPRAMCRRLRPGGRRAVGVELELELEVERRPRLEAFTHHVRAAAAARPHLLLAYAWVLYMALFSGGRYIRGRLRRAGVGFWNGWGGGGGCGGGMVGDDGDDDEKGDVVDRYLGFWTFEGEEDGEDLKAEFKERFAAVEGMLTEGEREEVVREAVFVMRSVTEVVVEISEVLGRGVSVADVEMGGKEDDEPSMRWLLLKHVLPMGMVELIAAGAETAVSVGIVPSFWSARAE